MLQDYVSGRRSALARRPGAAHRRDHSGYAPTVSDPVPDPALLPWVRVGAYAIVTDPGGRILLCRIAPGYPLEGRWTLPGGGVDHGEHPDDAVIRELEEETGLVGVRGSVAAIWSGVVPRPMVRPGPLHWVAIVYHVDVPGTDLRLEIDGSTDRCEWFSPEEARSLHRTDLVDQALVALSSDQQVEPGRQHAFDQGGRTGQAGHAALELPQP